MLTIINTLTDQIEKIIENDPVRPNIPKHQRLGKNKDIFTLFDKNNIDAITCVSYTNFIPIHENNLFNSFCEPNFAVFYTIWSYKKGMGKKLIFDVVSHLKLNKLHINRLITLSPKTTIAEKFHLNNGAVILNINDDTINFEYKL